MKKVLYLSLVTSSVFSMQLDLVKTNKLQEKLSHYIASKVSDKTHIKPESVFAPSKLGLVELYHGKNGFYVRQDDKKYEVKKYFTDPMVRDVSEKQLKNFLKNGYLSLNQMNDGEFSLKAKGRVNGGGVIGTIIGASLGKIAVSLVGHGAIVLISICTGPAAIPTAIALESYFGAQIELASIKGAIAGGILLGVATGPVWSIGTLKYFMDL